MKDPLKLIGYWMAGLEDMSLPLPQEVVGEMTEDVREKVCGYLTNGRLFCQYRGYSWCRFRCGIDMREMGSAEYTDGEWVWPGGLVHYVREHAVLLPEEFLVRAMSGAQPLAESAHDGMDVSLEFWVRWASERQSPHIRQRLAAARIQADEESHAVITRLIHDARNRGGEGTEPCVWAGCGERALLGKAICARHMINDSDIRNARHSLYCLPVIERTTP